MSAAASTGGGINFASDAISLITADTNTDTSTCSSGVSMSVSFTLRPDVQLRAGERPQAGKACDRFPYE